ncbi:MAG: DNA cytosine methyltransferase [Sphingomonas sp.]|nr:DNA cytosine methyltransferase [Sphingomonas sp.]
MFQGLFIDNFAGGGGASTGIEQAIGRAVDIAINHDPEAVAMHRANHPGTEHYCQDIWQAIPIQVTRGRPVGGAWFSPDCKEHSKAKGGPVKDRNIRELAWTVVYWMESVQPEVVFLENVEEFSQWGPLIQREDGKWRIDPARKGEEFRRWCRAIRRLGYRLQFRELRACDYGAPTSRKRLYVVARRDGGAIVWPKPTHGLPGSPAVRAGRRLPYRTAAECIDWSLPCPSIFLSTDEAKAISVRRPLAENTLRRVAAGVMRFVVNAKQPFIVPITHTQNGPRIHSADEPLRTITTANGGEFMVADVVLAPHVTKFRKGSVGSAADVPMPTVTANAEPARPAGAMPLGLVSAHLERMKTRSSGSSVDRPAPAATTKADEAVVACTMIETAHGQVDRHGKRRGAGVKDLGQPMPTQTTSNNVAAVACTMVQTGHGEREGQAPRALDIDKPLGTVVATAQNFAAVTAFLSSFYTSNANGGRGDPRKPLKTALAGGQHHAVVCAHVEQANTGMVGHRPEKPLSTIVGKGCTQRVVQTTLVEADALPPEMMAKATRVAAFLIKYYGPAIGQAVDEPLHTATAKARFAVVTVTIDATTYVIVDIGLRMLTPRELARAQGFPDSYVLDAIGPSGKPLSKAAQIRMIGNSVCPDVARALVRANMPAAVQMAAAA